MIIGIGSDLADIRRIERTLARFGTRFTHRVFTEIEREKSDRRRARAASYAKRWAAKEACAKALGTGLRMGVAWSEMGVVNLATGQPTMRLTGAAARRLRLLTPQGGASLPAGMTFIQDSDDCTGPGSADITTGVLATADDDSDTDLTLTLCWQPTVDDFLINGGLYQLEFLADFPGTLQPSMVVISIVGSV